MNKYYWCFPGGESYAMAEERALSVLDNLGASHLQRPLLIAHEMINRMLLKVLLRLNTRAALALSHPNDAVYEIDAASSAPTTHRAQY